MPHRILVSAEISEPDDEELQGYLSSSETVRGVPFTVTILMKNLGESRFPGGFVERLSLKASGKGGGLSTWSVGVQR